MNASFPSTRIPSFAHKLSSAGICALLVVAMLLAALSTRVQAQAPGLLWSTNIGARLFAVDSQTNAYANAGGTVIVLTGNGVPLQTNSVCPRPGLALRDED